MALGPANNFVMAWQDASKSYNLDENYSVLQQVLDKCEGEEVSVSSKGGSLLSIGIGTLLQP